MWTKLLFRLRTALPEIGPLLGSWKLSVVLMVLLALYYGFLAVWSTSSPAHVVQNIASLLPFWMVYGLLLVNTGVCLWRRYPALKRDLLANPTRAAESPEWQVNCAAEPEEALAGLRTHLKFVPLEDGRRFSLRRRWAALGTYLFHCAFFLIALGFLLTLATRYEARIWTAVGEEFQGAEGQYLSQTPPGMLSLDAPSLSFRVEEILPEFWGDQLLFTKLESRLTLPPGRGEAVTRINRPLWVGAATFLRLSGFGYTPRYEIADSNGLVLESAFAKMNLFPPGQEDMLVPERFPFRIYLEVLPDYVEEGGGPATASLNLRNPAYRAKVTRGKQTLAEGLLTEGKGLQFEGLLLSFPEIRYWGEFTLVRDAGAPILFVGFLVGFAGLLLKVRGKRAEVLWVPDPCGQGGVLKGWGCERPEGLDGRKGSEVAL